MLLKIRKIISRIGGKALQKNVRAVITNGDDILLVRNKHGRGWWNLPGGMVEQGESDEVALRREIAEELGILVPAFVTLGSFPSPYVGRHEDVTILSATVPGRSYVPDRREIVDVGWFPVASVPHDRSPVVDRAVSLIR